MLCKGGVGSEHSLCMLHEPLINNTMAAPCVEAGVSVYNLEKGHRGTIPLVKHHVGTVGATIKHVLSISSKQ